MEIGFKLDLNKLEKPYIDVYILWAKFHQNLCIDLREVEYVLNKDRNKNS